MNWKIKRDPYYSELYEKHGRALVDDAGFFEDTATEDVFIDGSVDVPCTPYNFLLDRLKESDNPCVLLSTGSFCPVHDGHIDMMVNAYRKVESEGYEVIGGYMSPGHDEYISEKTKEQAIPVHERIKMLDDKLRAYDKYKTDWIAIDPWEGVFCKTAVNFTDVVERLRMYLLAFTGREVAVFFVCGGDNARFAQTFMYGGNCVVVNRPGYEDRYDKYKELLKGCDNILWANGVSDLSSTEIRNNTDKKAYVKKQLMLRMTDRPDVRRHKLLKLLKPHFSYVRKVRETPDNFMDDDCRMGSSWFAAMNNANFPFNTISLDSQYDAVDNLEISRHYDCFGIKQLGYGARPGSKSIDEQLSNIDKGAYYLYDDDIHTGGTMRYVRKLLEDKGYVVMGELCTTTSNLKSMEILDERDFYVGHKDSGLVIMTHDGPKRTPYVYPYVCPYIRASISDPMAFSIAVWQLNLDYWGVRLNEPDGEYYSDMCAKNLWYLQSISNK